MRTTVELPDELLQRARIQAVSKGQSLKEFFIDAIEEKLSLPKKGRRPAPVIGRARGRRIGVLTAEQIDEAMLG